jgi:hypothetical protein
MPCCLQPSRQPVMDPARSQAAPHSSFVNPHQAMKITRQAGRGQQMWQQPTITTNRQAVSTETTHAAILQHQTLSQAPNTAQQCILNNWCSSKLQTLAKPLRQGSWRSLYLQHLQSSIRWAQTCCCHHQYFTNNHHLRNQASSCWRSTVQSKAPSVLPACI